MNQEVIVTCAVTGAGDTVGKHPAIPVTPQQIADAARAYRVYYQKVPGKDGGPYLMDHSSIVYLLDRNGRFVTHFTHEAKAEAIAASVGRLL